MVETKGCDRLERFECATRILSGPGSVSQLSRMPLGRLLLVTDPYFRESGTAEKIATSAQCAAWELFSKISPDPTVDLAAKGAAAVRSFRPDTVVALGGGSAMDCAKAMAYFSGLSPRLIAIPTTSGSGSEVTDFSVLTHEGVKHPLVDPKLRPELAIIDPELVTKLPPALIADGGFDVLTHALEAYGSKNAGPYTDALAEAAFRTTLQDLPASFSGDQGARARIHTAATMAGLAFTNAGLGLCHALSHSLGGHFHLPHGRLNAILLPAVLARGGTPKYAQLARASGLEGKADTVALRNLRNALIRLRRELHLPATLAEAGVAPSEVRKNADGIVSAALSDPCAATDPLDPTPALLQNILTEVTGHG